MILGHNPGLQALAIDLVGSGDPELRRAVARKFPTAAIAVIGFDVPDWAAIKPRGGTLTAFRHAEAVKTARMNSWAPPRAFH